MLRSLRQLSVITLLCLSILGCTSTADTATTTGAQERASSAGSSGGGAGDDSGAGPGTVSGVGPSQGVSDLSGANSGASEGPNVPGLPNNNGKGSAVGSPVKIPRFLNDQGRPLDEVRPELVADLTRQCGGSLCVHLVDTVSEDPNFTLCQFVRTEPAQDTVVERGSIVKVVSGSSPCEEPSAVPGGEAPPPDVSSSTTGDGGSSTPDVQSSTAAPTEEATSP